MVDNRTGAFDQFLKNPKIVQRICDRRCGVGADGLVEIRRHPRQTFEMKYYNSDGNEGPMCGNGARCSIAFGRNLGILKYNSEATFMASDGPHYGLFDHLNHVVHLRMSDVDDIVRYDECNYFVNTGAPVHVRYVEGLSTYDVIREGRKIRYSETYMPSGTNVLFVEISKDGSIQARSYERGVEDETYSCGTGAVAVATVESYRSLFGLTAEGLDDMETRDINYTGGKLTVSFLRESSTKYTGIYLIGSARRCFEGSIIV